MIFKLLYPDPKGSEALKSLDTLYEWSQTMDFCHSALLAFLVKTTACHAFGRYTASRSNPRCTSRAGRFGHYCTERNQTPAGKLDFQTSLLRP
ncbi:MAG: hypothetical protein O7F74_11220 [Bacteroidetes bacterium]|nr:hypothetical protein [Bacteroidota bacterium]